MDKRKKRAIELGKDLLIVLLACSGVYMAADLMRVDGLSSLWKKENSASAGIVEHQENSSTAWPVRLAVTSWNGESAMRYGVQYNWEECQTQFQTVASLLREALSSPGVARTAAEREWREALSQRDSLYFDLLGSVPLSVLSGWLSGEETGLEGTARRLVLSTEGDGAVLYYQDSQTGMYYARQAELVNVEQLRAVTAAVVDNGAKFAFELEGYEDLEDETLLLPEPPQPRIYTASNPLSGEAQTEDIRSDSVLGGLLTALSFPDSSYIYSGTDQVIRSGNDTLRLSSSGVVRYIVAEGETSRYLIPAQGETPTQLEIAETCRALAEKAVGGLAGEGRLFLREMKREQGSWSVQFGYQLDGIQVQVGDQGYAAHFRVEGNEIAQFTLRLRTYADAGTRAVVLPERQAMAAMQSMNLRGQELILLYSDLGGDTVSVGWVAY